eukprot:GEMP01004783.1.p1 GENE.GEMP01004783.1~~GEMP01004783.1.p1  ORF type:complete len:786 (+),score=166.66 GEMP01004783.1:104-2461(+)
MAYRYATGTPIDTSTSVTSLAQEPVAERIQFFPGDQVEYWSQTHSLWMEAKVQQVKRTANRLAYCLDIKANARPERIRRSSKNSDEAPASQPGSDHAADMTDDKWGHGPALREPGLAEAEAVASAAAMTGGGEVVHAGDFYKGEYVEYWSDTHECWMSATVQGFNAHHDSGLVVHLDIKKNANPAKIRRPFAPEKSDTRQVFCRDEFNRQDERRCSVPVRRHSPPSSRPSSRLSHHQAVPVCDSSRLPSFTFVTSRVEKSTDHLSAVALQAVQSARGIPCTQPREWSNSRTTPSYCTPSRYNDGTATSRTPFPALTVNTNTAALPTTALRPVPSPLSPQLSTTTTPTKTTQTTRPHTFAGAVSPTNSKTWIRTNSGSFGTPTTCAQITARRPQSISTVSTDNSSSNNCGSMPHMPSATTAGVVNGGHTGAVRRNSVTQGAVPSSTRTVITRTTTRSGANVMQVPTPGRESSVSPTRHETDKPVVERRVIRTVTKPDKSVTSVTRVIYRSKVLASTTVPTDESRRPSCMSRLANKLETPPELTGMPKADIMEAEFSLENFDPRSPDVTELFQQFLDKPDTKISALQGFQGGLNEGVWQIANEAGNEEILKLVKSKRLGGSVPTEAENIREIASRYPGLLTDESVCFPNRIIHIINGKLPEYDLFVMRKSSGRRLAEVISVVWRRDREEVYDIFMRFGAFLAAFHQRYDNSQHIDVQPSNIFYDEATKRFTLIDAGGLGMNCANTDVEHFNKSLSLLSNSYGKEFSDVGSVYFEKGYYGEARKKRAK